MASTRKPSDSAVLLMSSTEVEDQILGISLDSEASSVFIKRNKKEEQKQPEKLAEILVVHRPRRSISHWWRTAQIFSFFLAFLGGVCACISLGRLRNSFVGECPLFASLRIGVGANLSDIISPEHITATWGISTDCGFCQYSPMFGSGFAIIFGALFLQCGRGVAQPKSISVNTSWMLVFPTIPVALTFFIISCISLANTVSGLLFFCSSIIDNSDASLNITSCPQVYKLPFPYRSNYGPTIGQADIDRYSNFLISEIGASLHFFGWFLALFLLLIRCCSHADFYVLSRKKGHPTAMMKPSPGETEYLPLIMNEDTETMI